MRRYDVDCGNGDALRETSEFFCDHLAIVEAILSNGEAVVIVFPPGDHTYRETRGSLAASLARRYAPARCNVVGGTGQSLEATLRYIAAAEAVTGQYLEAD